MISFASHACDTRVSGPVPVALDSTATPTSALAFALVPGPDWTARADRITAIATPSQQTDGVAAMVARVGAVVVIVGLALAVWQWRRRRASRWTHRPARSR